MRIKNFISKFYSLKYLDLFNHVHFSLLSWYHIFDTILSRLFIFPTRFLSILQKYFVPESATVNLLAAQCCLRHESCSRWCCAVMPVWPCITNFLHSQCEPIMVGNRQKHLDQKVAALIFLKARQKVLLQMHYYVELEQTEFDMMSL